MQVIRHLCSWYVSAWNVTSQPPKAPIFKNLWCSWEILCHLRISTWLGAYCWRQYWGTSLLSSWHLLVSDLPRPQFSAMLRCLTTTLKVPTDFWNQEAQSTFIPCKLEFGPLGISSILNEKWFLLLAPLWWANSSSMLYYPWKNIILFILVSLFLC